MPNDLLVHPGDLITADLWNKLLSAIDRVDARIDANEARVVPDVVGDLLGAARDEIARARLELQTVLDAEGTRVDIADATLADRIVLAQMPSPEDFVRVGRRVTLLITAAKVRKPNAPDLTAANPVGGGSAQVGKGLELVGTAFTGKITVSIRNTALTDGQFKVDSATKITIPKVPLFEGAPGPGATKAIPITVGNENGTDSFTVNFSEPQIVVANPVINNVRFRSKTSLSIIGASLNPPVQDMTVTVLNDNVSFKPVGAGEIVAETNDKLQKLFSKIDAETFENLLTIDKKDHFLIDVPTGEIDFARPTERGIGGGPAGIGRPPIDREPVRDVRGLARKDTIKMFLLLSPSIAKIVAAAPNVTVKPSGTSVAVQAGRMNFKVDLNKLFDVEVVVRAGEKRDTFLLKVGEVS